MEESAPPPAQPPTPAGTPAPKATVGRTEDFFSGYSNNVAVESNAFDLKIVFGLLDQRDNFNVAVEQFASINIAWPEVKLLIYMLRLHLAGYELENGNVKIPSPALPPELPEAPTPQFDNPRGQKAWELIRKMRREFIDSLREP